MKWLAALVLLVLAVPQPASAVRAKDVGQFHGVRDNPLTGAGLVVGLKRTGDSTRNEASIRALASRLQGLGVSLQIDDISARNVALVMVSARLGPSQRTGSRIDVSVASTGDATSIEGGYLLLTPLMGPDGQVYALAEGPLVVGGYQVDGAGSSQRKNSPTVGQAPGGAIVEREVASAVDLGAQDNVEFVLSHPDFTTASRLAKAIDDAFGTQIATPRSSSTVALAIPSDFQGRFPDFAAKVESVELSVDAPARVVVSERTGTVVMGADVRISAVAVAHGGLTIEVRRQDSVSQPGPFSPGQTTVVPRAELNAEEKAGQLLLVEGVSIGDLVAALNKMGVTPRDLIVILQAIQSAGALHAEVVAL
ncbi:MAG: flagellar basal body P-ring protein FlgI [Myxococcota bacterium]